MNAAITTVNMTKRFPRTAGYLDLFRIRKKQWVTAVENVSLDIREGELFGLLGPNGAGKTTFIKLICSLVLPSSGEARVFGHDIVREEQTVKKLVGLVSSEERSFYWRLTGRENLQFYAALYRIYGREAKKRIDNLLEMVELNEQADMRFQNYSTGMRQKLAICRGLLSDPKVIFVDEPTRSLDPVSAQSVRSFIKEKVENEKKTVVLATHNLTEAEQLCDRLAIMDHGQVIALGTVKDLRSLFQSYEECRLEVRHLPEDTLAEMERIEGVLGCQVTAGENGLTSLKLQIVNREKVLPFLLERIVGGGGEVCNCQLRESPLEDIFTYALSHRKEEEH